MSKRNSPFIELFQTVIDSLEDCQIPYVLVRGTVMPYYGNIHSTEDIEIMLILDNIEELQLKS